MSLKTYTQIELEALLKKEPNAYIAVVKVEAVRLDTFLSSSRLGTEVPLRCIDQGQAYLENEARKGLTARRTPKKPVPAMRLEDVTRQDLINYFK